MTQIVYAGLIVGLVVGGGAAAYYFTQGEGSPQLIAVGDDLCRTDQTLSAHRIVIVDTSDPLSDEERNLVRLNIDREAVAAVAHEKVSVVSIQSDAPYSPKRLFSACAPKKATDATGFSENPRLYGAIWERRFGQPLDDAIKNELASGAEDRSPLIESLWAVSRFYDFGPEVARRRIVIMGDMLQNSPDLSQYRGGTDFAAYARSNFGRLRLPNLKGADVVIHYLARPGTLALQTHAHVRFWTDYFKAAGAATVHVTGMPAA